MRCMWDTGRVEHVVMPGDLDTEEPVCPGCAEPQPGGKPCPECVQLESADDVS